MSELRVVPDPHYPSLRWRLNGLQLEQSWTFATPPRWEQVLHRYFDTPERRAVWRDLLINPCVTDA